MDGSEPHSRRGPPARDRAGRLPSLDLPRFRISSSSPIRAAHLHPRGIPLMRTRALLLFVVLSSFLAASLAHAQPSKLDPRVRIAIASLQGGMSTQSAKDAGMAVNDAGLLDVFIRGSISRAELEALGVTVRTAL